MAINFKKDNDISIENTQLISVEDTRKQFDLTPARDAYKAEILASGEVDKLTSLINLSDTTSIVEFGKEPADKMSKVADQVISKYDNASVENTTKLVDNLLNIMKKIDIKELEDAKDLMDKRGKKSFFDKFKESAEVKLQKLMTKYKSLGSELESVCTQLCAYEQQIKDSNRDIARLYEEAKDNYRTLTAYILAGEQAIKEIEDYRESKTKEYEESGSGELQFELQNIDQALSLMISRVADLKGAESVALMSIPTFKIQEVTNANLARKVNSAFIVTIPAFKTALVNSVIAKQQALQAQGLQALDEATSVLIRKNADNVAMQLKQAQKLANTSAIKADDIEYSWNTILNGIEQYKEMEKQYRLVRNEESKRIEAANEKYIASLTSRIQ